MVRFLTFLLAAILTVALSVSGFAQKGGDNRPPKDKPKVVEKPKPPPNNGNKGNDNNNKRGRP